ncbi:response regulator transcription factor [Kitasatospora aureofaciens]|uniref:response regulator transcription factor n=1 Tax=Kitasatospora aureofaciens TaxID=1894 RepID=UPI001C44D0C9|nr:response regulator transcription factor [Kitasatospora aureofaciens]MBV6699984.1 response regulator transcription factor [Kitasatospora aureofaciens]
MHMLLVEDDDRMAQALATALARRGHTVRRVVRATEALRHAREAEFVLLDLGLPDLDGLDLLRKLRTVCDLPLIVVTARSEERDIVQGLRAGADDYVIKPFRMAELIARIDTVRRRSGRPGSSAPSGPSASESEGRRVRTGDVAIDLAGRSVTVDGVPVRLTRREFDVLALLAAQPGDVRSREEILDRIWGDAFLGSSRSLDVHVAGIRAKTGRAGLVRTIRGYGYQLGDLAAQGRPTDERSGA